MILQNHLRPSQQEIDKGNESSGSTVMHSQWHIFASRIWIIVLAFYVCTYIQFVSDSPLLIRPHSNGRFFKNRPS
ncbi:hypothetical protein BDV25DRAFT_162875 [Aspergillus avenaceus]|uniref:Uncharacterized protein n=1 Tax=Aspergillus avenaceus TaxID=36643 RepID=A0A5N6TIS2_ASPAV|nr:hypothetical protein BDV25DRAFT_162875 [Aspergillus avenaceus]